MIQPTLSELEFALQVFQSRYEALKQDYRDSTDPQTQQSLKGIIKRQREQIKDVHGQIKDMKQRDQDAAERLRKRLNG